MMIPVSKCIQVFGTDSFEMSMNWRDPDRNLYDLANFHAAMVFFVSKEDRTVVKTVTDGPLSGSRIVLSSVEPNIYIRIVDTETQVGGLPAFTAAPGFYILDISPPDIEITDRLMHGKVRYEP